MTCTEITTLVSSLSAPISVLIAAMTFIYGVFAWKREFVGKRRIELAETVLARFYEAGEVTRAIRSPFGWSEEGKSRKRQEE